MTILSSLYDIRKINNGFLWSTMFVFTGIPLLSLYDNKTVFDILYPNDYLKYLERRDKFNKTFLLSVAIAGFIIGYNKRQTRQTRLLT